MGSSNEDENELDTKEKNPTASAMSEIKKSDQHEHFSLLLLVSVAAASVAAALLLELVGPRPDDNAGQGHRHAAAARTPSNKYWVYGAHSDVDNRNGLLKHVHLVLERLGYQKDSNLSDWSLLWSHDYPFRVLRPSLHRLAPHQRVNHFPGTGFITNKVDLATSDLRHIPKAFKLPQNKREFLEYAKKHKQAMFLQKHNQHRGVYLKNVTEIDLETGDSFVQEYVQKPLLVDGHKFDIGAYVVLTSVNPLRAYWYKGDVLFRYCPAEYYPFSASELDKYVVADDYLPTWLVPSLAHSYNNLAFGMKDSFDIYMRSEGKDPSVIWDGVQEAIAEALLAKEKHIIEALKSYPSQENFFEMMRFDLVVDEELGVHLLEANMSPNLSSAHFTPNQLLYEQVLNNLFAITGVAAAAAGEPLHAREKQAARSMVSAAKNIAVFGLECAACAKCTARAECALCAACVRPEMRASLLRAHTEFLRRGDFRRLMPPPMRQGERAEPPAHLSEANRLQHLWYQGKCDMDITWCT